MYQVNNLPKNYAEKKYVVVKDLSEDQDTPENQRGFWFYGAYDSLILAQKVQEDFYGSSIKIWVLESSDVEPGKFNRNIFG